MTIKGFREPPEISKKLLKRSGGFVYFVEALGLDMVKIGAARDVDRRLRQLQVGCPVELKLLAQTSGGEIAEVALHRRFEKSHVRGDWFRKDNEISAFLNSELYAKLSVDDFKSS